MRASLLSALLAVAALVGCGGGGSGSGPSGVAPVPTSPRADAYEWTGNTRLRVFAQGGLRANDPPGAAIVAADSVGTKGGTVAVDLATGAFTYDPPLGLQNATDTFTYQVAGFPPVTVTVNLRERVWFVRNDDVGPDQGTDRAPFHTLAQAEAASDADDVIFVFAGNAASPTDFGQDRGIALKPGQKLIGEGVGLNVAGVPVVDPVPNARLSNQALPPSTPAPVVLLATRNEVAGFDLEATYNEAILAFGGTGHHLHDNTIAFGTAGSDGIRLLNVGGANVVTRNVISGSRRDGIELANDEDPSGVPTTATPVTATVTMSGNTITGSAHDGISVHLDGSGTDVTVNVLTNTIGSSGTSAGHRAIAVAGSGAARVKAVVSANVASGSAGQALDLAGDGGSSVAAFVASNALSMSGTLEPATDFRGAVRAGSSAAACLELIANRNGTRTSTFLVENSSDAGGRIRLFDAANGSDDDDTPAIRQGPGPIDTVEAGACAVPLEGAALFEANCGMCHTGKGLGRGHVARDITGASASRIALQLQINLTMIEQVRLKTQQEIQAIANALAP